MSAKIRSRKRGYCPEQDCTYCIDIDFVEIRMSGDIDYKKVGLVCEYLQDHGCNSCGRSGEACPIFKAAHRP